MLVGEFHGLIRGDVNAVMVSGSMSNHDMNTMEDITEITQKTDENMLSEEMEKKEALNHEKK